MALKIQRQTEPEVVHKVLVESQAITPLQQYTALQILTQEYLTLYKKLQAIDGKNLLKRMEDIRKQLVETANSTMADASTVVFTCADGEIEFSERGMNTEVENPQALINDLAKKFGAAVAMSVVDIMLGPLRKILSEHEIQNYTKKVPGSRAIKAIRVSK